MNKNFLIFGGLGVVGFLAYKLMQKNAMNQPNLAYQASSNMLTQPSQLYPFQPVQAPRSDYGASANQPWSAAPAKSAGSAGQPMLDMNFTQNVAYVKGLADVVKSGQEVWSSVASWFEPEPVDTVDAMSWGDFDEDFSFTA